LEQFAGYSVRPKPSFGSALRHANAFSFSRQQQSRGGQEQRLRHQLLKATH